MFLLDFGNEEKSIYPVLSMGAWHFFGDKILPTSNKFFGWAGPGSNWKFTHLSSPPNNDQLTSLQEWGSVWNRNKLDTFFGPVLQEGVGFCWGRGVCGAGYEIYDSLGWIFQPFVTSSPRPFSIQWTA